jgi:ATP-dependent Clp protease ATP-binding subunit ClpA
MKHQYESLLRQALEALSIDAQKVVVRANAIAVNYRKSAVNIEHLLMAVLDLKDSVACQLLMRMDLSPGQFRAHGVPAWEAERTLPDGEFPTLVQSPEAQRALLAAQDEASKLNHPEIDSGHLLLGIIKQSHVSFGAMALYREGIDIERARVAVIRHHDSTPLV